MRSRTADEQGSVAAEFAVTLPAVMVVFALCVGGIHLAAQQVALQAAAANSARAVARADRASAAHAANSTLPGARVSVSSQGSLVCATVSIDAAHPLVLPMRAKSCALGEGK